jgi:hypothetical protein
VLSYYHLNFLALQFRIKNLLDLFDDSHRLAVNGSNLKHAALKFRNLQLMTQKWRLYIDCIVDETSHVHRTQSNAFHRFDVI